MELASEMGVQTRELINDGAKIRVFLRGGMSLGPNLARYIAHQHGFGVKFGRDEDEGEDE